MRALTRCRFSSSKAYSRARKTDVVTSSELRRALSPTYTSMLHERLRQEMFCREIMPSRPSALDSMSRYNAPGIVPAGDRPSIWMIFSRTCRVDWAESP